MPVWLFRCNYEGNRIDNPQYKDVPALYEQNCCPITILENEKWDRYCLDKKQKRKEPIWEEFTSEKDAKKKPVPSYIKNFINLFETAQEEDVLVILEYNNGKENGRPRKLGILRNINSIDKFIDVPNLYEVFCLKLDPNTVITISENKFEILNGLFLPNVTLGKISNRKKAINELYRSLKSGENQVSQCLDNLPNEKIEDLCARWLQTDHAKVFKLRKVYVENGKLNFPVLDIMGRTFNGEVLAAQVSYTEDCQTIINKVKKLVKIHTEKHLMFTRLENEVFEQKCKKKGEEEADAEINVEHVCLGKVWDDLNNDKNEKDFILKLFKDSYQF